MLKGNTATFLTVLLGAGRAREGREMKKKACTAQNAAKSLNVFMVCEAPLCLPQGLKCPLVGQASKLTAPRIHLFSTIADCYIFGNVKSHVKSHGERAIKGGPLGVCQAMCGTMARKALVNGAHLLEGMGQFGLGYTGVGCRYSN